MELYCRWSTWLNSMNIQNKYYQTIFKSTECFFHSYGSFEKRKYIKQKQVRSRKHRAPPPINIVWYYVVYIYSYIIFQVRVRLYTIENNNSDIIENNYFDIISYSPTDINFCFKHQRRPSMNYWSFLIKNERVYVHLCPHRGVGDTIEMT